MAPPAVHHVELCVRNAEDVLVRLQRFGFSLFARQLTPSCKSYAIKLGDAILVIRERLNWTTTSAESLTTPNEPLRTSAEPLTTPINSLTMSAESLTTPNESLSMPINSLTTSAESLTTPNESLSTSAESLTTLCCERQPKHVIDSVFNVAFDVSSVEATIQTFVANGGKLLRPVQKVSDANGTIVFAVVQSSELCCGNVIHTILNKDSYSGFLPGFESVEYEDDKSVPVSHIDHVTLAVKEGDSEQVIKFYERTFNMVRFSITSEDDEVDGLILDDGVGLRLKALEYFRCSQLGLSWNNTASGLLLVVVETLPNQTNCNVETFLREHGGPGIEHIAFHTNHIVQSVTEIASRGVRFRKPPATYYKQRQWTRLECDISELQRCGILLDVEQNPGEEKEAYLMQIFSHPIFDKKTFFIELIRRVRGARGLGTGNIKALVRSIREEEATKANQINHRAEVVGSRDLC